MKKSLNEHSSIRAMLENPSSVKRPVLVSGKKLIIGFKEDEYKTLL